MRRVAGSGLLVAGLFLALLAALAPETAGAGAAAVPAGQASSNGELLFRTKGCAGCHSISAFGISALIGGAPDLSAARDFGTRRPGLAADAYLAESIREPQAFLAPGATGMFKMPDLGLTVAEIDALVRYLLSR